MFDIDGTLVNSYKFDEQCYLKAAEIILGINISSNWSEYKHATDAGILDEVIDKYGIIGDKKQIQQNFRKVFIDLIEEYIRNNPNSINEIDGAAYFIQYLCKNENYKVAIATGGWEETAKLKLRAAGINVDGCAFASSSDHHSRVNIMNAAESKTEGHIPFKSKTYFGDASWDKEASEFLNYRFILVGNRFKYKYQIQDFKDIEYITEMLNF